MMTLPERVLGTLRIAAHPMTTKELARKMRMDDRRLSGCLSRLHSYGVLEREPIGGPRAPGGQGFRWWPKVRTA